MNIEELLYLELEGLTKTITDYTRDNFIISYSLKLSKLSFPEDKSKIHLITKKLLDWYEDNIEDIKSNQYLPNVNAHIKSINILEELYKQTI